MSFSFRKNLICTYNCNPRFDCEIYPRTITKPFKNPYCPTPTITNIIPYSSGPTNSFYISNNFDVELAQLYGFGDVTAISGPLNPTLDFQDVLNISFVAPQNLTLTKLRFTFNCLEQIDFLGSSLTGHLYIYISPPDSNIYSRTFEATSVPIDDSVAVGDILLINHDFNIAVLEGQRIMVVGAFVVDSENSFPFTFNANGSLQLEY